jgi:protein SCO1/2
MRHAIARLATLAICLFLAAAHTNLLAAADPRSDAVLQVTPFPPGGDFTLSSRHGPLSLGDLRQQVVILYFGYTHCPDVCPTSLANLQRVMGQLSAAERQRVKVVFVSVDPERDTPSHLGAYTEYFGPEFVGVTGPAAVVAEVAERYGAQYRRVDLPGSDMQYGMDHSSAFHVIDPRGRLRALFRHTADAKLLADGIRYLQHEAQLSAAP